MMNINELSDLNKKIRENEYLNKETFPTLDFSIEGIDESIRQTKKECLRGEKLLEEIDQVLSNLYSKLTIVTSSSDYSINDITFIDRIIKEFEDTRFQIYEVYRKKSELRIELELLRMDLLKNIDLADYGDRLSSDNESILDRLELDNFNEDELFRSLSSGSSTNFEYISD